MTLFGHSTDASVGRVLEDTLGEATMQHLLAASLIFLIFGFGTAASLGTAKALQDWAASNFDANGTAYRGDIAQRRSGRPSTFIVEALNGERG
jgi:hypothetical protein